MSKRLFIAVDIAVSEQIVSVFQKLKEKLNNDAIKWVSIKNFHLTLKFLGDTEEELIPEIVALTENIAHELSPFKISIKNLGKFSQKGHTKVIWMGIEDRTKTLELIAQKLNAGLEPYGFKPENRKFKAHLTLARVKYIRNEKKLNDLMQSYSETVFHTQTINRIILYESLLRPAGPVYIPLNRISIGK